MNKDIKFYKDFDYIDAALDDLEKSYAQFKSFNQNDFAKRFSSDFLYEKYSQLQDAAEYIDKLIIIIDNSGK